MTTRQSRPNAPRVSVDGVFLDEVRTRLDPETYVPRSVALRSYPAEYHRLIANGKSATLRIPAITALQLYHDGVMTANREHAIELKVGEKEIGRFFVESLGLVDRHEFAEPVLIRLTRVDHSGSDSR